MPANIEQLADEIYAYWTRDRRICIRAQRQEILRRRICSQPEILIEEMAAAGQSLHDTHLSDVKEASKAAFRMLGEALETI